MPWETRPGAAAPDHIDPGIIRTLKPLHHNKAMVHGGAYGLFVLSVDRNVLMLGSVHGGLHFESSVRFADPHGTWEYLSTRHKSQSLPAFIGINSLTFL